MAVTVESVERKIRNRRRDLVKKLAEIAITEEKKSKGEPIDVDQEASILSKPAVEISLKEVDYLLDSLFPSKEIASSVATTASKRDGEVASSKEIASSVPTKASKRDDKALTENIMASDVPAAAASHYQYKLLICKLAYILWDLENAKIPPHFDTADVLPALSMFLSSFGFEGNMIVEAIIAKKTEPDRCPLDVMEALENMVGVTVYECEEVFPQASDMVIQSRIDELAQRKEKAVVVVMAGDGGYVPSLLAAEQYESLVMFVCYPYGKLDSDLKQKFRPFGIICFEDLMWNYATIEGRYKSLKDVKMEKRTQTRQKRQARDGSRSAFPPPTDPFTLTVEEKLKVALTRDGGLSSFDMWGTLSLHILNQEDGLVRVQIETGGNPEIRFKTHPVINQRMFENENILGRKRPDEPFRTGEIELMRWRMQRADESMVPLTINCWPSVSGNETYVSLEYEASSMFDLTNVIISVPLPALREAPSVRQCDGEWRYDPRNSVLEWSILLIDNSNRSGSMEFVVPPVDSSVFFPISVQFAATSTYSGLKVTGMIPLRGGGGATPRFVQRTQLVAQSYQVV